MRYTLNPAVLDEAGCTTSVARVIVPLTVGRPNLTSESVVGLPTTFSLVEEPFVADGDDAETEASAADP